MQESNLCNGVFFPYVLTFITIGEWLDKWSFLGYNDVYIETIYISQPSRVATLSQLMDYFINRKLTGSYFDNQLNVLVIYEAKMPNRYQVPASPM